MRPAAPIDLPAAKRSAPVTSGPLRRTVRLTSVALAVVAVYAAICVAVIPVPVLAVLFHESGVVETASVIVYLVVAVIAVAVAPRDGGLAVAVTSLVMVARELDFNVRFTTKRIDACLSACYFLSARVPTGEKLVVAVILLALAGLALRAMITRGPALLSAVRRGSPAAVSALTGVLMLVVAQPFDEAAHFLRAHDSRALARVPWIIGETLELVGPVMFVIALLQWRTARRARAGVAAAIIVGAVATGGCALAGDNFHAVWAVPDLYRSAQLSPDALEAAVARHRIRTVINLRGPNPGKSWYEAERQLLDRLDVRQVDIALGARRPPSRKALEALIRALREEPAPILVHCRDGADRSALAAAVATLLRDGTDVEAALREFAPLYGHLAWGRYASLQEPFRQYEAYLAAGGPPGFEQWVGLVYPTQRSDARPDRGSPPE